MTQTPLSDTETVLIGLAVLAVVIVQATWELAQHFSVIAHEGMHAFTGSVSGRRVKSVTMNSKGEGETIVAARAGPGSLLFLFTGYLGPSAFGLGAARLIQYGHIIVVLWLAMGLLALLLIALKARSFAFLTVPLAGFLIFLVLKHTPQTAQVLAVYAITWFLLLSGVRGVVEHGAKAYDAGKLNERTNIPRLAWALLWLGLTLAAVAIGARWMLHPVLHH